MTDHSTAPGFTVVMAVHNGRTWLREALDSALAQDPPPREVIVVNDGSTDDTAKILAAYGERITVIDQQHAGVSVARNRGIDQARAEWIALLDADDAWRPGHLASLGRAVAATPEATLVYADAMVIDETGNELKPKPAIDPGPDALASLLLENLITTSAAAARRDLILQAGGFRPELHYGEDWDLWLRLARLAPVVRAPGVTVLYRRHPGGAVSTSGPDMRNENLRVLDRIEKEWPDLPPELLRKARARRFEESAFRCLAALETQAARMEAGRSLRIYPWRLKVWLIIAASLAGPFVLLRLLGRGGPQ